MTLRDLITELDTFDEIDMIWISILLNKKSNVSEPLKLVVLTKERIKELISNHYYNLYHNIEFNVGYKKVLERFIEIKKSSETSEQFESLIILLLKD